jgi:hypothetical protein
MSSTENIAPTAVEEIWENERYMPIRGWGTPFGLISSYSDRSGHSNKTMSNDNNNFPEVPLKSG